MYIITINYSEHDTWHTYVIKSRINAFHGYCMVYAQHHDDRMVMTKQQVKDAIHLYCDEPRVQHAMRRGVRKIASIG